VGKQSDPAEAETMQFEQLLDLALFFLGEMKDEDAVQFIQVCFQHMHRKKLAAGGMKL